MKKVFLIGWMLCCCAISSAKIHAEHKGSVNAFEATSFFQQFISHQVEDGETVYSISKKYGISEKEIYKLNPDAKARIYEGLVLILPSTAASSTVTTSPAQEDIKFKTHKVKRKETLYSISKKYDVTEDELKKYNKQLYSQILRKGDKIRIPIGQTANYGETAVTTQPQITTPPTPKPVLGKLPELKDYVVQPKETKYGIARKYGISVAKLEELNPAITQGLKEGVTLKVPDVATQTPAVIDESQYAFYEVKKGNTMYSLLRDFDLKADDLLALNPALEEGLKEGMILKVPKGSPGAISTTAAKLFSNVSVSENAGKASLADKITDYSVKNIAVMLPFGLKRATADSSDARKNMLKRDRVLRLALDFHSGVLMAVEDAEKMGITANVVVYDTDYKISEGIATNARKIENLIHSNNFNGVDAVIGPLLGGNVDRAASLLASKNIPVVSPLTQRITGGANVFQSRPSDAILRAKMMSHLKGQGEGHNVVIIADSKNASAKAQLKKLFPNAKMVTPRTGDSGIFFYGDDISNQIVADKPNLVIVETNDVPLISSVTTTLNSLISSVGEDALSPGVQRDITLYTTYKGSAYNSDEIQHMHLMNLNFHFPSMEKEFDETANTFIDAYESRYKITPSTHAIRGYDIMLDTLLRLGYAPDLYQAAASGYETQYIENKFNYAKSAKGYYNDAVYIMRYEENLLLKEVEIPAKTSRED